LARAVAGLSWQSFVRGETGNGGQVALLAPHHLRQDRLNRVNNAEEVDSIHLLCGGDIERLDQSWHSYPGVGNQQIDRPQFPGKLADCRNYLLAIADICRGELDGSCAAPKFLGECG